MTIDLTSWKLTLPVDAVGDISGSPLEVLKPVGYRRIGYFFDAADGALVFRAPVDGATTSGSKYPRCELREMQPDGKLAAWQLAAGGSVYARLRVDEVPIKSDGRRGRVVIGQIHGQDDELVRLYWEDNSVYFVNDKAGPKNKETRFDLLDAAGEKPNVPLGMDFAYYIRAKGSDLEVSVSVDWGGFTSLTKINKTWAKDKFYFKAGLYLGVNETQGKGWGQASFYALQLNRIDALPTPTPTPVPPPPPDPTPVPVPPAPVVPGAPIGFGRNTTGGLGKPAYRVTNLNDAGPGSLREGVSGGSKSVSFDADGTIMLGSRINVGSDVTIDGSGKAVIIKGAGLSIARRNNVIIRGLTIRDAKDDAIKIFGSSNVLVEHCTLQNAIDGLLDITEQSHDVTVAWCHFRDHAKCMLIGANPLFTADAIITATIHHCFFERTIFRNPYVRFGRVHIFNNVFKHWGRQDSLGGFCIAATMGAQVLVENNEFIPLRNPVASLNLVKGYEDTKPGYIKERGNLLVGNVTLSSFSPERVFEASDEYPYTLDAADQALVAAIEAGAGA